MALLQDGKASADNAAVDPSKALRVTAVQRTLKNYSASLPTGTIAAALAANSSVFAMRLDPGSGTLYAFIQRVSVQWMTLVAFTTPVQIDRRLALFRGTGAAASGGTALAAAVRKRSGGVASEFDAAGGGDIRVATTAGLTVAGITFETDPIRQSAFGHVGASGGYQESVWEFDAAGSAPILLEPGQVLAIRNPVIMGAAGTFQLIINVDWHEGSLLDATVDA